MPEHLECEVLQKARYINTLTLYLYLLMQYPVLFTLLIIMMMIMGAFTVL